MGVNWGQVLSIAAGVVLAAVVLTVAGRVLS